MKNTQIINIPVTSSTEKVVTTVGQGNEEKKLYEEEEKEEEDDDDEDVDVETDENNVKEGAKSRKRKITTREGDGQKKIYFFKINNAENNDNNVEMNENNVVENEYIPQKYLRSIHGNTVSLPLFDFLHLKK